MTLKLSILDQTPIRRGSNAAEALRESIALDVDEIVVATFADTREDRLRSYELLAGIFHLKREASEAASKWSQPDLPK